MAPIWTPTQYLRDLLLGSATFFATLLETAWTCLLARTVQPFVDGLHAARHYPRSWIEIAMQTGPKVVRPWLASVVPAPLFVLASPFLGRKDSRLRRLTSAMIGRGFNCLTSSATSVSLSRLQCLVTPRLQCRSFGFNAVDPYVAPLPLLDIMHELVCFLYSFEIQTATVNVLHLCAPPQARSVKRARLTSCVCSNDYLH